jgi:hypothetical protein
MTRPLSIKSGAQGLKSKRFFDRTHLVGPRYTTASSPLLERLEKRMVMSAPSGLTAFGTSDTSVTVTWTDNATTETHFIVDRSVDGVNYKRIGSVPANSTSFPDTGLQASTQYFYRVKAITTTVNSGWSRVSGSTLSIGATALPVAPSGMTTSSPGTKLMNVMWNDPANNETHFLLERSTDGINYRRIASMGANTTSFVDSMLTSGTQYQYRIRSVNGVGGSKWVRTSGTTIALPAMPSGFAAAAESKTQLQLTWVDTSNNESGFVIDRSTDGINYGRVATLPANTTSYLDDGLEEGRTYLYNLKSTNLAGSSKWVRAIGVTEGAPTTIFEDFSADSGQFVVVDGSWTLSNGTYGTTADNNAATTHLNTRAIHETAMSGDFLLTVDAQAISTGNTWNNFAVIFGYQDPNNYYFFSSNQNNDAGTNGIFRVVDGASTELANIAGTITAGVTYQLKLELSGGSIKAYRNNVLVASANDSTFISGQIGLGSRQFPAVFDNLIVTGSAIAPPTSPPASPSDLLATAASSTRINLTWSDNSSDESRFKIEKSTDGVAWSPVATVGANSTSYSVNGLKAATGYFFRVFAGNVVGDSEYSNTAEATTQEAPALVKPDATNTGPDNPEALVGLPVKAPTAAGATITAPGTYSGFDYTGKIIIDADNVILENFISRDGGIEVAGSHDNVTIRNFRMFGFGAIGSYSATNLTVEHGEMSTTAGAVIWGCGRGLTCRYLYIHDVAGDVFRPSVGGLTIEHCFVDKIGVPLVGDKHADVLQAWNLDGVIMRYNNFSAGAAASGVLTMYYNNRNVLIEYNWFAGAGYGFSVDSKAGNNNIVRHNRWASDYRFGPVYPTAQTYEIWEDNTLEATGQTVDHF